MRHNWLRAVPFIVTMLLSAALTLCLIYSETPHIGVSRLVGTPIEAFDLPVLGDSNAHFTPKAWQGKVVMLNVFASWCVPCAAEHPVLQNLAKSGVVPLYGLMWGDTPEKADHWLQNHGNPFQAVGLDENGHMTVPLALTGVPETFIIDRKGIIRYHLEGAMTDDIANTIIVPLVERLNQTDAP